MGSMVEGGGLPAEGVRVATVVRSEEVRCFRIRSRSLVVRLLLYCSVLH